MEAAVALGLVLGVPPVIVYVLALRRTTLGCPDIPYGTAVPETAFIALIIMLVQLALDPALGLTTAWILLLAMGLGALLGLVLEWAVRQFARVIEGRSGRGRA